jgi:hypothetical protein
VDVGCKEKVVDIGNKQDAGMKLCQGCTRGWRRCEGRDEKMFGSNVLVGLRMIQDKKEGSKVVVIDENRRMRCRMCRSAEWWKIRR